METKPYLRSTLSRIIAGSFFLLFIALLSLPQTAKATHLVGSDISYKCTGTPGVYEVTVVIYRDCDGIPLCSGDCSSAVCTDQLGIKDCNGGDLGNITLSYRSVRDVNPNPRCPSAKSICDNLGCVTAGTMRPGVERYEFYGTLDVNSLNMPAGCCMVRVFWTSCCRNEIITTGSAGEGFYVYADINTCLTPCNSSPELTNDPFAVMCGGQPSIFNNGALDPDFDSLSFSFSPSLQGDNTPVDYIPPYSYQTPMPWTGPANGTFPAGIKCDPLTGDIMFTPVNGGTGTFVGVMAIEVKQWITTGGTPVLAGVTRRDIQMWVIACPPNNPPRLMTNPSGPSNQPQIKWEVCAGELLCFDIIAKDTDFKPPTISDTTYLSILSNLPGATFTPNYVPAQRTTVGPREDSYKFCWQPPIEMGNETSPYYFTVKGADSRCPFPGTITRAFSILVHPVPNVQLVPFDHKCGNYQYKYVKLSPPARQTYLSVIWKISKAPYDFSFNNGSYTYSNVDQTPIMYFPQGGKYLVTLNLCIKGPPSKNCCKTYVDTLTVDTQARPILRDTFVCIGSSVKMTAVGAYGMPPYTYRWYNNKNDTLFTLNGPYYTDPTYTSSTTQTKTYSVQIRDFNGCRGWDSLKVTVKDLPVGTLLDTARICYGDTFRLDPGTNGGNIRGYKWNTGDSSQTITRKDSNTYVVLMTDTFGCQNTDTMKLYVNQKINAQAGIDTAMCSKDTLQLNAAGGQLYQWKNLTTGTIISAKSYNKSVKINPTNTNANLTNITIPYEVKVYQSYPDTTKKVLECFNLDTVNVTVKPLPILSKPIPWQMCYPGKGQTVSFPGLLFSVAANPGGGTGVWSYPQAPGAVINGSLAVPSLKVDSLKSRPDQDTVGYFGNWLRYTYKAPQAAGGCTSVDSGMVVIYGIPKVDAGNRLIRCSNAGAYEVTNLTNQSTRGVKPIVTGTSYSWSMLPGQGGGLDSIINTTSKKYFFYADRPDAKPTNIIKYSYLVNYPANGYTTSTYSCQNSDTTQFLVIVTPKIDAGTDIKACKNETAFQMTKRSGAGTVPSTNQEFWDYTPPPPGVPPANPAPAGTIIGGKVFDPTIVPQAGGNYMVYFVDTSSGCAVYDSTNMIIAPVPIVKVTYLDQTKESTVCRNTDMYMLTTYIDKMDGMGLTPAQGTTDKTDPNYSYQGTPAWEPIPNATGVVNAQFNSNTAPPDTQQYLIFKYSMQTGGIYCTSVDTAIILLQDPPVLQLTAGGAMCSYDSTINVSASLTPSIYSIKWNSQDGSFANDTMRSTSYNPNKAARQKGTAWVHAITINPPGGVCLSKRDSTFISINPSPDARIVCANCDGCEPLTATLGAGPSGVNGAVYQWIWDDGYALNTTDSAVSRFIPAYTGNGQYPVKLKVTTPGTPACSSISTPTTVYVRANPKADFEPEPPFTTIAKPFFNFINHSVSNDNSTMTYLWNMGPLPPNITKDRMMTETNPTNIEFAADTGWIPVRLYVTTAHQCTDSTAKNIRVEPDITVFVPNAFYPGSTVDCQDGDPGCNRVFKISAAGYSAIEIFVFNRWGQQVFYTTDAEKGWDGKFRGEPASQDVYIYQVNATSFSGKQYKYSGSVTLLR